MLNFKYNINIMWGLNERNSRYIKHQKEINKIKLIIDENRNHAYQKKMRKYQALADEVKN